MRKRVILVSLVGASLFAWPGAAAAVGVPPQLTEGESRALAGAAAGGALAAFAPTLGAVASPSEPFARAEPEPFGFLIPPDIVRLHSWWLSTETPGQVIAYVSAHPPGGFRESATGYFEGSPPTPGTPTLPTEVQFASPAVARARGRSIWKSPLLGARAERRSN